MKLATETDNPQMRFLLLRVFGDEPDHQSAGFNLSKQPDSRSRFGFPIVSCHTTRPDLSRSEPQSSDSLLGRSEEISRRLTLKTLRWRFSGLLIPQWEIIASQQPSRLPHRGSPDGRTDILGTGNTRFYLSTTLDPGFPTGEIEKTKRNVSEKL